jgi:hypothetical protein
VPDAEIHGNPLLTDEEVRAVHTADFLLGDDTLGGDQGGVETPGFPGSDQGKMVRSQILHISEFHFPDPQIPVIPPEDILHRPGGGDGF